VEGRGREGLRRKGEWRAEGGGEGIMSVR